MGTVSRFISMMGYTDEFKGMIPGTSLFSNKWKELAKNPKFNEDQHEFIKKTHYEVQLNLLKSKGIDLSKKGPAVQDAIWSTSVQFGGNTLLILKALSKLSPISDDCAIITAIQDYKINNNNDLFKSSSSAIRVGTLKRAKNEKADLLTLCKMKTSEENDDIYKVIDNIINFIATDDKSERNS